MDGQPSFSIVVPVYNGASTLPACLDSLLALRYPPGLLEVIVVDNASTDSTAEVISRYPFRSVYCRQPGPAAARNAGIEASCHEIVAFTDSDCVVDPNWIQELARAYASPEVVGAGGPILPVDEPSPNFVQRFSIDHSPLVNYISGEHEYKPRLYTANASFRRMTLIEAGCFNPLLFTGEDVDLSWRVQTMGNQLAYAAQAVIYHHHRHTWHGLSRQYRQYGFGEILLDVLYASSPGYPRTRRFQLERMAHQACALPRYGVSFAVRWVRYRLGKESAYGAVLPALWLLIESSNLLGKLEALAATRFMSGLHHLERQDRSSLIRRYFPLGKE